MILKLNNKEKCQVCNRYGGNNSMSCLNCGGSGEVIVLKEIDITKEELAELNKQAESVVWKPEYYDIYYIVDSWQEVETSTWRNDVIDNFRYNIGNCFETIEEALKSADRQQALARVKAYIRDNDFGLVPDWSNGEQYKYRIYYNHQYKRFNCFCSSSTQYETEIGHLKSEEACKQVWENMEEDLLLIYGVK